MKEEELHKQIETLNKRIKELEQQVKESSFQSEEKYRDLVEHSNDLIQRVDIDGKFLFVNKAWLKCLEYTQEDLKDLRITDILRADQISKVMKLMQVAAKGNCVTNLKTIFITKSGKEIYVEGDGKGIFENNKFIASQGFFRDITERKKTVEKLLESEEKYRLISENAHDWVYWRALNGSWNYLSPSCERVTGYSVEEFMENPNLLEEIIHPDDKKFAKFHLAEEKNEHDAEYLEFRIISKSGEIRWISHTCNPVYSSEGQYIGRRGANRDITERKLAEDEVISGRARLDHLLTKSAGVIYSGAVREPFGATFISKNVGEVVGYEPVDFLEDPGFWASQIHPDDVERVLSNLNKIFEIGFHNHEYRWKKKDGTYIWLYDELKLIYDKNGKPIEKVGTWVDITERKLSEEDLRTSKQLIEGIINSINTRVFWKDKNLEYLGCNTAFSQDAGFSNPNEIIGKDDFQMGWRDRAEMYRKDDQEIMDSGRSKLLIEESMTTTAGNLHTVLTNKIPLLSKDGEVIGVLGTFLDITERKRFEQIQKILYNISNAVSITDNLEELIGYIQNELGTVIDTTNYYIALYDTETDTISLPYFADEKDTFPSFPAGNTLSKYVITTQKPLLAKAKQLKKLEETRSIKKFGTNPEVWLGVPLKVEGKITGVLVVQSYDNENAYTKSDMEMLEFVAGQISISIERKKAEENLQNALVKATESDRLKSAFLATMSHELRTPLNAILGFSEFLDKDCTPEDAEKFGEIINSSGNHLLSIVEDLMEITLIESGEINITKEVISVQAFLNIIYSIIKVEQLNANKEDVAINMIIPPKSQDITLYTDPTKLKQILINLLKNAIKFTKEGFIDFGFSINKNKSLLEFFVKDSGIGIKKEQREFIFDIFRQADDTHTRKNDGVGIGLSISKKLTTFLGGEIWVDSQEGKGSEFYFTIPFENQDIDIEINEAKTKITPNKKSKFDNKTILVVEDEISNFEFLKHVLQKSGMKTIWAKNGKEAIKYCLENPDIALVLMDIRMPVMNGYTATKEIKQHNPGLPIIAQTAFAMGADRKKAKEAGCDDYISKPIDKDKLIEIIENYIKS